jgi:hypothetical protein
MPKAVNETLDAFLQRQDASTLCAVLLELSIVHSFSGFLSAVMRRLMGMVLAT